MITVSITIAVNQLPAREQEMIERLAARNQELSGRDLSGIRYLGGQASHGFEGIRSAHGIRGLRVLPLKDLVLRNLYSKDEFPSMTGHHAKIKYCWFSYAENAATEHAGGMIPALIEFSGSNGGRILFDYVRDLIFYSPTHYESYWLVTDGSQPKRSM